MSKLWKFTPSKLITIKNTITDLLNNLQPNEVESIFHDNDDIAPYFRHDNPAGDTDPGHTYKIVFSDNPIIPTRSVSVVWYTKADGTGKVYNENREIIKDFSKEKTTIKIPVGINSVKLYNMYGNSLTPIIINENGISQVILEVGEEPIYLVEEIPKIAPLDLIFVIDTTGSMWDDIAQVKLSSTIIVNLIDFIFKEKYRVAVVDYRDFPIDNHGVPGIDYPYKLNLPFSNKKDEIVSKILSLDIGNGLDWDESVYTALVKSMKNESKDPTLSENYGWRKGVNKVIILMADAPPHDKDPSSDACDGGCTIEDVAEWSSKIDPVLVYSIVIGPDPAAYNAFSEISERTGGKIYTSATASDVVGAIIEAIGDIGDSPNHGVSVNINPAITEANPGQTVIYSIDVTNTGTIADTFDISIYPQNFAGTYRGYPIAIQESWTYLDQTSIEIEPDATETVSLTISVPNNWAGMENVIYPFDVTAKSEAGETISNTSSAELRVKVNKRSIVEYSKLETVWLSDLVRSSSIDDGIKNSLSAKLTNAGLKLDQAISNIENGNNKQANNMLSASKNIMSAFINQVNAQYDKKIMQPDANVLIENANTITQDIQKAIDT